VTRSGERPRLEPSRWQQLLEGCGPAQPTGEVSSAEEQVRAVTQALLAAAQTRDMATNTGGVKWRPKQEGPKKLLTAEQIVARMRVSYPALRASGVDAGLRQLFLSELITQQVNERREVVLPEGTAVKMVSADAFKQYKELLSGLDESNVRQVTARLMQMGLAGGEVS
jgi:hypothetical protein